MFQELNMKEYLKMIFCKNLVFTYGMIIMYEKYFSPYRNKRIIRLLIIKMKYNIY